MKSVLFLIFIFTIPHLAAATPNQLHTKLSEKRKFVTGSKSKAQAKTTTCSISSKTPNSSPSLNLKSLMSPAEQKAAGLSKLSKQQLSALDAWLTEYIESQNQTESSLQSNDVSVVLGEGHYVKLGGGEVWTISPNAWIYTYYWKKGDPVVITQSGDKLFPSLLTNQNSGQAVNAVQSAKSVADAFEKGDTITKILSNGQYIELSDGSSWQVQSGARYMVQGWSVGAPVFVIKRQGATGPPYELYNGETSRNVFVSQIKAGTQSSSLLKNTKESATFPTMQADEATSQKTTFPSSSSNR